MKKKPEQTPAPLTREQLADKGYLERDSAYNDYRRGDITEREYLDFCSESYKRQDEAGRTLDQQTEVRNFIYEAA